MEKAEDMDTFNLNQKKELKNVSLELTVSFSRKSQYQSKSSKEEPIELRSERIYISEISPLCLKLNLNLNFKKFVINMEKFLV